LNGQLTNVLTLVQSATRGRRLGRCRPWQSSQASSPPSGRHMGRKARRPWRSPFG
jgi:hypothetical protein